MKTIIDAFLDWLSFAVVFGVQTGLVFVLILLVALLVMPEATLMQDVIRFLKGLV